MLRFKLLDFSDINHFDVAVKVGRQIVKVEARDVLFILLDEPQVGYVLAVI
jgi:hypothetical protein